MSSGRRSRIGIGLGLALACSLLASPAPAQSSRAVHVEAREPGAGSLLPLQGVNAGPWTHPGHPDFLDSYIDLGVAAVRTHDFFGPTDIAYLDTGQGIFPDMTKDPFDPASYRFGPADEVVQEILDAGAEVFFRIGYSAEMPPMHNDPPADPEKWAEVAAHIVMHYNEGWANGFHFGIRRWEIWNEADDPLFWNGTPEQFFDLYERTARRIRQVDPSALVGGPGLSQWNHPDYRDRFVRYCKERGVPLDFLSWHRYDATSAKGSPGHYRAFAIQQRQFLDGEGMPRAENVLSEWSYAIFHPMHCLLEGAAFDAATLSALADGGIDGAHRYRGDDQNPCHNPGLHYTDGARKPPAYAIQAWDRLQAMPHRRRLTGSDWDHHTAIAGRSEDGRTLRVLVSNYDDTGADTVDLEIAGLGTCGVDRTVARDVLTEGGFVRAESFTSASDPLAYSFPSAAPAVTIVTVSGLAPWPANLRADTGGCPAALSLAWDAVGGASGYRVYLSDRSCDEALAATSPAATVSGPAWDDTAPPVGASRYYAVEPIGAYGSCDGDRRCIAAGCPGEPPGPVTGLRVERSGGDLRLSWNEAARATGYRVYRTTHPDPRTWGWPWREGIQDEDPA
ncbi:MAG: hypothetical protein D6718_02875, partial [Acidobacteria bacterium]